jgi:hypothetical protein
MKRADKPHIRKTGGAWHASLNVFGVYDVRHAVNAFHRAIDWTHAYNVTGAAPRKPYPTMRALHHYQD